MDLIRRSATTATSNRPFRHSRTATFPVTIVCVPPHRLDGRIEASVYYLVAESLTNAAKHAHASEARIEIQNRRQQSSSSSATTEAAARARRAARDSGGRRPHRGSSVAALNSRARPETEPSCGRRFLRSTAQIALAAKVWSATPKPRPSLISGRRSGFERELVPRNPQKEPEMNAPSHALLPS